MPSGLKNAPSTFRTSQLSSTCLDATTRLRRKTYTEKCTYFAETINRLDHVIRPDKFDVAESTTNAFRKIQDPAVQTEIRFFLGLCYVFRRFVRNVSRVIAPFNKKLCKDHAKSSLLLTGKENQAGKGFKNRVLSPPVFALTRAAGHFTADTDSGDQQIACVLLQEHPVGPAKPI